jgi:hypothetical protein
VEQRSERIRFPTVEGSSLSGVRHRLPGSLAHDLNLLLVAFRQWQQKDVDTWAPVAAELASTVEGFGAYELPVISRAYKPFSGFIDGGMRSGIPDAGVRDATITLYIDRAPFMEALGIRRLDAIAPMLVTPDGAVLWQTRGPVSDDAVEELRAAVARGA